MQRQHIENQAIILSDDIIAQIARDITAFRQYVDSFETFFDLFSRFEAYRFQLLKHLYRIEDLSMVEFKRLTTEKDILIQYVEFINHIYRRIKTFGDIYTDYSNALTSHLDQENTISQIVDDFELHVAYLKINYLRLLDDPKTVENIKYSTYEVEYTHNKFQLARLCYSILIEETATLNRLLENNLSDPDAPNLYNKLNLLIEAMAPFENDILCQVTIHLSCLHHLIQHIKTHISELPTRLSNAWHMHRNDPQALKRARHKLKENNKICKKRYAYIRCLLEVRRNAYILGQDRDNSNLACLPDELIVAILTASRDPIIEKKHANEIACRFFNKRPPVKMIGEPTAADAAAPSLK